MKCPFCKSHLHMGKAAVARPTVGMIADVLLSSGGLSPHYLYFYPKGDEDNPRCIDFLDQAHHCSRCGTVIIQGPQKDDGAEEECLSCGKVIPPNQTACPACGWSWGDTKD